MGDKGNISKRACGSDAAVEGDSAFAHPSALEEFPQAERTTDEKRRERRGRRAKEKIIEYKNSCAIRGLPSALYRVLPLLNIEFRSRYPRLDESRTSGPSILRTRLPALENSSPGSPGWDVNGGLNFIGRGRPRPRYIKCHTVFREARLPALSEPSRRFIVIPISRHAYLTIPDNCLCYRYR